jgi:CRP-like cAMP-binding protein
MTSIDLIRSIAAFKGMSEDQLEALRSRSTEVVFERAQKLFTEGDDATDFWVVVEGRVDLRFELPGRKTSADHTVSSVQERRRTTEANYLGWSCFVPPHKMRLSAYCVSDTCKVVKIAKDDLLELFTADPEMGYTFMTFLVKVVGFRFHQFQNEVAKNIGEDLMAGW